MSFPSSNTRPFSQREHVKSEYARILERQAQERSFEQKRKKQEELEYEKRLLRDGLNNDPFGK